MNHRIFGLLVTLTAVLAGLLFLPGTPAQAAPVEFPELAKSAGQKFAIKSLANNKWVSAEINDSGSQEGKLRARSDSHAGSWEQFTLHTMRRTGEEYGLTGTLRSEANGLYVSAETEEAPPRTGMLRAGSADPIGLRQRFTLVPLGGDIYALMDDVVKKFVSARIDFPKESPDYGLLRSSATSIEQWEKFEIKLIPSNRVLPPAQAGMAKNLEVMSWNVCTNNSTCDFYKDTPTEFADRVKGQIHELPNGVPDVLVLQEFCEKYAKPLELMLEGISPVKWDVRFAPITYKVKDTSLQAQKSCARDTPGADRGAYGVAIAVPESNTWFEAYPLPSPDAINVEQRTALCAIADNWAVSVCTTHFTSRNEDDVDGRDIREDQSVELNRIVSTFGNAGYRTVFGGDLNATPTESISQRFYSAGHKECDSASNRATNDTQEKIDYIFGPANASWSSCYVDSSSFPSDHRAIAGTVNLP
ncbi:endonuclease/exonuclease/phosphatase family protein [Streptomyces sp. NPDC003042]